MVLTQKQTNKWERMEDPETHTSTATYKIHIVKECITGGGEVPSTKGGKSGCPHINETRSMSLSYHKNQYRMD